MKPNVFSCFRSSLLRQNRTIAPCCYTRNRRFHASSNICVASKSENDVGNIALAPLKGFRILDLTRVMAGPYCTMLLGDLGAEVIKIERPGIGDDTRAWVPPAVGNESIYFLSVNRNKKSVAINMKSTEGQKLIQELAKRCDVLIENFIPDKLIEMNLDYKTIEAINPQLIYCSISGYGQTGPYKHRAGYDSIASGMGGMLHITGNEDGQPVRPGVAITDITTGLYAHGAIMAAIIARQQTNRGQHIDCNLLSSQVAVISHIGANYLIAGLEAKKHGTGHGSIVPYQAFKTQDGFIMIGGGNNKLFRKMCQIIGMEELSENVKFLTNELRVANRKELIKILSKKFSSKNTEFWLEAFEDSGIPYGPVNTIQQVYNDPQVLNNQMISEMEHPTAGKIRVPGPAVHFSETDVVLQYPPPTLGQHTDQVLSELIGLNGETLKKLRRDKIIE